MTGSRGSDHSLILLGLLACLAGCHRRQEIPARVPHPHYVVGEPWQGAEGAWFYPREQLGYHETGLAVVVPTPSGGFTADGERFDPDAMAAAHQTLQLPCVVTVRNLENGRVALLRVNNRGPAQQGRLLGLTPRAASVLGMSRGVPARVEIVLDAARSQRASDSVGGGPHLDIEAAPVEGVQEQSLALPGTHMAGPPDAQTAERPAVTTDAAAADDRLPPVVQQGSSNPGALWIDGGQFGQRGYADQIAMELGGSVRSEGQGRQVVYIVREGPFQRTSDADAALDQARHAGVTGARIIVE